MPFHDVTAAAVLYGDFSPITRAAHWANAFIYLA
jgi:hypothetical protein